MLATLFSIDCPVGTFVLRVYPTGYFLSLKKEGDNVNAEQRHIAEIMRVKREIKQSGPIHKKDLIRYKNRLERELIEYRKLKENTAC